MEDLISQLSDADPEVRGQAVFELGETEDPAAVPHLIKMLADDDLYVRVYSIQALGELNDPSAIEPLCELLHGSSPHRLILSNVCVALGELGDERAVEPLTQLLQSSDPFSRYDAANALGDIGHPSAVPALKLLVGDTTMPEYEDEEGDLQNTLDSVGERAKQAIEMIESN